MTPRQHKLVAALSVVLWGALLAALVWWWWRGSG
jgi:hypothetical protein